MLRKMLLVSPEYFERLRRHDDDVDTEAYNERRNMPSQLEKNNTHPYNRWVTLREIQDPLLRRAQKKETAP